MEGPKREAPTTKIYPSSLTAKAESAVRGWIFLPSLSIATKAC